MQLANRDTVLATLRPYRGLEERIFAPTSSFGLRLGDNNDASYQFGKRGDVLPMNNDAWDYIYKIGGLKGVGLDKYPRPLVAPILDEALRRQERELKAVVREGEIIAFTGAEAQVNDPVHMLAMMERGIGGRRAVIGYQVGGGWDRQFITLIGGAQQEFGQVENRQGRRVGDMINYGVTATFTPLGIDLPSTAVPLEIGGFTHQLVCTNGAVSTQNVMSFTRKEARGDREDWIREKVGQVYAAGQFEFDRIRSLQDVRLSDHTAETLDSTFSQFGIPTQVRGMIARRLINQPAPNMYGLWGHITYVASNFARVVEDPFLARRLQTAAGHIVEHHLLCQQCHRLLPRHHRINQEIVEAVEAGDRNN
jgi:hypothetical protein